MYSLYKAKGFAKKLVAVSLILTMTCSLSSVTTMAEEVLPASEDTGTEAETSTNPETETDAGGASDENDSKDQTTEPDKPSDNETGEDASLESEEQDVSEEESPLVAFFQTKTVDGVQICVSAPEGVFPKDATLVVEPITNPSSVSRIEAEVSEEHTLQEEIESSYTFDISILDAKGNAIQPDSAKGNVEVSFSKIGVAEAVYSPETDIEVYHVSDDLSDATPMEVALDATKDAASITTTHFSIFTVVIKTLDGDEVLHYYQGTSKANSYFTLYNEKQLKSYRDIINKFHAGTLPQTTKISAILVNSDDANPLDGIKGNGQAQDMTLANLNFSAKLMDDITVSEAWSPIALLQDTETFDGAGHTLTFSALKTSAFSSGTHGILIDENRGIVKNTILCGNYNLSASGSATVVGGIVGTNKKIVINSTFTKGKIAVSGAGSSGPYAGSIVGLSASGAITANVYAKKEAGSIAAIGQNAGTVGSNIIEDTADYPDEDNRIRLNQWVKNNPLAVPKLLYWGTNGRLSASNPDAIHKDSESEEEPDEDDDEEAYATVTIRVDGQKAEIGQAITGSEALAASYDGENYITLVRDDDLSVYRTKLSNLEPGKVYHVYYVYEDENETISAADISRSNPEAELDYVSVTYDLEGANTFKRDLTTGKLSENVMAAVRVDKKADGSYEAQEDYEAVIMAAEGYEIPSLEKNVSIKVNGRAIKLKNDFTYSYNARLLQGTIKVPKAKVTGPMVVKVVADSLEDQPKNTIILKTRGGSLGDPLWDKTATSTYRADIYDTMVLPEGVSALNGSTAVEFAGWYEDMACSGTRVRSVSYEEGRSTRTFYAKWILKDTEKENSEIYYQYKSGGIEVQGRPYENGKGMVTFSNGGFRHAYTTNLTDEQKNGANGGLGISVPGSKGNDAFTQIPGTNIYVAMVCTLKGSLLDLTYIFENRGNVSQTAPVYFGAYADVDIAQDDGATIEEVNTGTVGFMTMTARPGKTYAGQQYKLYTRGTEFGVDQFYSYWYGSYGSHGNKVFTNQNRNTNVSDSALAFSWEVKNIAPGEYVTKTTKMGMANAAVLNNVSATLHSTEGRFSDGTTTKIATSDQTHKEIVVNADGTITAKNTGSNKVFAPPTRTGWKFSHWSVGAEGGVSCVGKTYTDDIDLYANWIPQPDKAVTNNSSIRKVKEDSSLLVPEELGHILITNTTPGSENKDGSKQVIRQGETIRDAAGYASGFNAILSIEGEDNRYLLPDDIEVTVKEAGTGKTIKLTKDTGYSYEVWNNRKSATVSIRKQYINGDVTITAIGYELPPVTATQVRISVAKSSIQSGERAQFTATAFTSKNHMSTYQWYVAPYYEKTLDNETYWTYQNQAGEPLQNGTYTGSKLLQNTPNRSGNPITISGANKATLRIDGLDVSTFSGSANEDGLHVGGYHVYCEVTSTRNITGQQIVKASQAAEVEVTKATYDMPTGLEGSSTTYNGGTDGSVLIEQQTGRPAMQYKKSDATTWTDVTATQVAAGEITGLSAGTYQFKYKADTNHLESRYVNVTVDNGKHIVVRYTAAGADDEHLLTQLKHVPYNANVTASTPSADAADGNIVEPKRMGFTFVRWEPESITGIKSNALVQAVYDYKIIKLALNNQEATTPGSNAIYEKYSYGFYRESNCQTAVNGTAGIDVPKKDGYDFLGYYTRESGGIKMINADGCLSENLHTTQYLEETTLYAHWRVKEVSFNISPQLVTGGQGGSFNPSEWPTGITIETIPPENESDHTYTIVVKNETGHECNTIYAFANGTKVLTMRNVSFDEDNTYTFTFDPTTVSGEEIRFVCDYISLKKEGGESKTEAELEDEEARRASLLNYDIIYKDVDGTRTGGDFNGTFVTTKVTKGVLGLATELPEVQKTGYTFIGWYLTPRGTGASYTSVQPQDGESLVTVYAKWSPNKYPIILSTNGGAYEDDYTAESQYEHGGENVLLPTSENIKKPHHTFLGWFDNADLSGNPITEVNASQVGRVTYYAGWRQLALHTITLPQDGDGGHIYTVTSADGYTTDVYDGADYVFTVNIHSAYRIKSVKANGKVITADAGEQGPDVFTYTIKDVKDNQKITVATEQLVPTEEPLSSNYVASIRLKDGTTGYFTSIDAAISYAGIYGDASVIKLNKDIINQSITAKSGHPFTIDLNGHGIRIDESDISYSGDNAVFLVEAGANVSVMNSARPAVFDLRVENRGMLTVGNGLEVGELLNLGVVVNNGTVHKLTQQETELADSKSRFENNGMIQEAVLESGYFVENVQTGAPAGLSGYKTIMNGNEYYVSFQDAVDIANASTKDATIKTLSTVDNRSKTIAIANANGKCITVDLNGYNISSGTIQTDGKVIFENTKGSPTKTSEISAAVNNTGSLTINDYVKLTNDLTNDSGAELTIKEKATVSGAVSNKPDATLTNNGEVSGILTNEGQVTNAGTMNNVIQSGGDFDNKGDILTRIEMTGGSYCPTGSAKPQAPQGAVATGNTQPMTYYGTIGDAIEDANNPNVSGSGGTFVITLTGDTDPIGLGSNAPSLDPNKPVTINLNGHTLGRDGETLSVGDGTGSFGAVSITNKDADGHPLSTGSVASDITVGENGSINTDNNIKINGDITNGGAFENKGTITGNVTNKPGGTVVNAPQAVISGTLTNEGDVTNGGSLTDVRQNGGTLENRPNATIGSLTQTGGDTSNNGIIDNTPTITGGGITGDGEENYSNKVAKITVKDASGNDRDVYFVDLDTAAEYAANLNPTNGTPIPVKVTLLKDIVSETVDITPTKSPANPIMIDLDNHTIGATSNIHIAGNADVTMADTSGGSVGKVAASIVNDGVLNNSAVIEGVLTNNGEAHNSGTLTSVRQQDGTFINESGGQTASLTQTGGISTNNAPKDGPGAIGRVDLQKGGFNGTMPTTPIDSAQVMVGDTLYGDVDSALDFVSHSTKDETIKLLTDISLPAGETTYIGNGNGKKVTVDLNGNALSGGPIQIGTTAGGADAVICDTKDTGTINNPVHVGENSSLGIKDATVNGSILNEGTFINEGTLSESCEVTNQGTMKNRGEIEGTVKQEKGTLENEAGGTISRIEQNGGITTNQGEVEEVSLSGGDFGGNDAQTIDYDKAKVEVTTKDESGKTVIMHYPSLTDALNHAKSGDVIKLLQDISGESLSVATEKVTIDLNGKTIDETSDITITTEATGTVIKDTAGTGVVKATIENNGSLTNEATIEGDVTNKGNLLNKNKIEGTVSVQGGTFTNDQNGYTEHIIASGGEVINKAPAGSEGGINHVDFNGGGYDGTEPKTPMEGAVAKIGNTYYADLGSAISDANKSNQDITITLIGDATIPVNANIGNEQGKKITIDVDGHVVSGGGLIVKSPGQLTVKDSTGTGAKPGTGLFSAAITASENTKVTVQEGAEVSGTVINKGSVDNKGTISGSVTNSGQVTNSGDLMGNFQNESGASFDNTANGYVGGRVTNTGTLKNEGILDGNVQNTGTLTNKGNIEKDITNAGNGNLQNAGNINGQLVNKDRAVAQNSGSIHQVNQSGGSITNQKSGKIIDLMQTGSGGSVVNSGTISAARIVNVNNFEGNAPTDGMEGVAAVVTYKGEDGNQVTRYFNNLEDAVRVVNGAPNSVSLKLYEDLPQTADVTINNPNAGVSIDLDGHTIGDGNHMINIAGGTVAIKDSAAGGGQEGATSGAMLSKVNQTGGTVDYGNATFNGIAIQASPDGQTKANLKDATLNHPPGSTTPAIAIKAGDPADPNVALKVLEESIGQGNTLRSGNGDGAGFEVRPDGTLAIGTNSGETLGKSKYGTDDVKSGLELVQALNAQEEGSASLVPANSGSAPGSDPGVKLNKDLTPAAPINITGPQSGSVRIDLNGHDIKGPSGTSGSANGQPAITVNGGALNIGGSGTVTGGNGAAATEGNAGNGGAGIVVGAGGSGGSVVTGSGIVISGGRGGSSTTGDAGAGGAGIAAESGASVRPGGGSSITGGKGGSTSNGNAGAGGAGVDASGSVNVTPNSGATVSGGNGGNAVNGTAGAGGFGIDRGTGTEGGGTGGTEGKEVDTERVALNPKVTITEKHPEPVQSVSVKVTHESNQVVQKIGTVKVDVNVPDILGSVEYDKDSTKSVIVTIAINQQVIGIEELTGEEAVMPGGVGYTEYEILDVDKESFEEDIQRKLGLLFDISILQRTVFEDGTDERNFIKDIDEPLVFNLALPHKMQGGSNYRVYRIHEHAGGSTAIEYLPTSVNTQNWMLSFSSTQYSDFGIVYTPGTPPALPKDPQAKDDTAASVGNGTGEGVGAKTDAGLADIKKIDKKNTPAKDNVNPADTKTAAMPDAENEQEAGGAIAKSVNCFYHWIIWLLAVMASALTLALRKRRSARQLVEMNALCIALMFVVSWVGICTWDIVHFLAATALVAAALITAIARYSKT